MVKGPALSPTNVPAVSPGHHRSKHDDCGDEELINETEITHLPIIVKKRPFKVLTSSSTYTAMATESPGCGEEARQVEDFSNSSPDESSAEQRLPEVDSGGGGDPISGDLGVVVHDDESEVISDSVECLERNIEVVDSSGVEEAKFVVVEDISQEETKLEGKAPMIQQQQQLQQQTVKSGGLVAVPGSAAIAVVQPTARTTYYKVPAVQSTVTKHRPNTVTTGHYLTPMAAPPVAQTKTHHAQKQQPVHHHHHHHRIMTQIPIGQPIMHHCPATTATATGTVGQAPVAVSQATTATTTIWPVVDPVFHFGPGFEPPTRNYCPKHEPQTQEHVVFFHVYPGVSVTFQIGSNREIVRGPVTVPMVSQSGSPPIPMPVQVPPGHLMQQIVDENGTLRHVILSTAQTHQIHSQGGVQHHIHGTFLATNGTTSQFYSPIPAGFPTGPPGTATGAPPPPGPHYHTMSGGHLQPPPPQPQQQMAHSPSPPNGNSTATSNVIYHNKDERLQQIHKKLQKKLEKRELSNATTTPSSHSASPRKINSANSAGTNGNGGTTAQVEGTATLNGVHKRNNMHKQIINNYAGSHNYHPQQQQPPTHHYQQHHVTFPNNSYGNMKIVTNSYTPMTNSIQTTMTGPRKVARKLGTSYTVATTGYGPRKKTMHSGGSVNGGNSSVGTSEDGEEATSSVPEDEEYQVDVEEEIEGDDEVDHDGHLVDNETNSPNLQHSEELPLEDDLQQIKNQLSTIAGPTVKEILSRSALLTWQSPNNSETINFNQQHLQYEILLSDSAKNGKYKSIFKGKSLSCRIQDLRPGVEYLVCLRVHYQGIQGLESPATIFNTPPCAPDTPLSPKLISRTKNSLQLRWNATADNGSHIQHYVLEYDQGRGQDFFEVCKTKGKQYTLAKLTPSTTYRFRLYAINEYGRSEYSYIESFQTESNPPPQPMAPSLSYATSSLLRLDWQRRSQDKEFILQMAMSESSDSYLPCYTGDETRYECTDLPRATGFVFRLKAKNEFGSSPWSPEVCCHTLPERPGRPPKPQVKGKIHSNHFKVRWDPPSDCGGASIHLYHLQIRSGAGYEEIYVGPDMETICDRLSPATTYQVRVSCEGPAGISQYSEPCTVTTEPIPPSAPSHPVLVKTPGVYTAEIRWDRPDDTGGSPILEYEVELDGNLSRVNNIVTSTNTNGTNNSGTTINNRTIVYRGKEMTCDLKQLLPGEQYLVHVRAYNRIGCGAWSDLMKFFAGAAPPNTPKMPQVIVRSPTHLIVQWEEPITNGAPITEYRLEMSSTDQSLDAFQIAYQGPLLVADLTTLHPFTRYYFKLSAANAAGSSNYSEIVEMSTPAGPPAAPVIESYEKTAEEVTIYWNAPESHGSEIINYNVEYSASGGKNTTGSPQPPKRVSLASKELVPSDSGSALEYTIEGLNAETNYRIRLRAVNEVGSSPYSHSVRAVTLPYPPAPPTLECTGVTHNSLKLKWGEGRNVDFIFYYVEMFNNRTREYQNVYSGSNYSYKVTKLMELTTYKFRICAKADKAGIGNYSEDFAFRTSAALPQSIKAPRIYYPAPSQQQDATTSGSVTSAPTTGTSAAQTDASQLNNVNFEWQHSKNDFQDTVEYILQICRSGVAEYKQIYRGPETRFTVENLDCGVEYLLRVCPVRLALSSNLSPSKASSTSSLSPPQQQHQTGSDGDELGSVTSDDREQQGVERSGGGEQQAEEAKHCDISELMGQWSPVLKYVHHHHQADSHHHNHIHHPHSHHAHHHHGKQQHNHHHHHHSATSNANSGSTVAMAHQIQQQHDTTMTSESEKVVGIIGKLTSLYSSRHNLSDVEKGIIGAIVFMVVAIAVAYGLRMIVG